MAHINPVAPITQCCTKKSLSGGVQSQFYSPQVTKGQSYWLFNWTVGIWGPGIQFRCQILFSGICQVVFFWFAWSSGRRDQKLLCYQKAWYPATKKLGAGRADLPRWNLVQDNYFLSLFCIKICSPPWKRREAYPLAGTGQIPSVRHRNSIWFTNAYLIWVAFVSNPDIAIGNSKNLFFLFITRFEEPEWLKTQCKEDPSFSSGPYPLLDSFWLHLCSILASWVLIFKGLYFQF